MKPTADIYPTLQAAYDHFNERLFDNKLPDCLITLSGELRRARGYYRNKPFTNSTKKTTDEIALNPFSFSGRTDREIYSTLVHEMVHLWQFHFGNPPKRVYHNAEWADMMEAVGLMPSTTGAEGGKRTGRSCSHYIIDNGPFDTHCKSFKGKINWRGAPAQEKEKKPRKRTKYQCSMCELNAYAKPGVELLCGDCSNATHSHVVMYPV